MQSHKCIDTLIKLSTICSKSYSLFSLQEILQTLQVLLALNNKTRKLLYSRFHCIYPFLCCYDHQPYAPQEQMWVLLWWVVSILNSSLVWACSHGPPSTNVLNNNMGRIRMSVHSMCMQIECTKLSGGCLPKTDRIKCHGWEPSASDGLKEEDKHQPN